MKCTDGCWLLHNSDWGRGQQPGCILKGRQWSEVVDTNGHKTAEFDPEAIKNRLNNEFENDCVSDIVTNQC